jgi:hypothetical protein
MDNTNIHLAVVVAKKIFKHTFLDYVEVWYNKVYISLSSRP